MECLKKFSKKMVGFTLIELTIVLLIISILAIFVMSNLPKTTINVDAQANQLAGDLRYTQTLAMSRGNRFRLVITGNTYQIVNGSTGSAITIPVAGATTVTLGAGITFGTLTNLPNKLVNFDTQGIPYTDTLSPGTALAANATIPITDGTTTKTVLISPTTGRVIVQ